MVKQLILVTGGAGHVGSFVIEELLQDPNNRIISLDNYSNGNTANHIEHRNVEYRRGSTVDIAELIPETPDIIYHLGEYARIAPSFDEPDVVFELNVVGTFQVVEFWRKRGIRKLVYAASSTKFGDQGEGRHQSPYALSKAHNVDLINDYAKWYGLDYAICYFFNGFGPRERGDGKYGTVIAIFQDRYLKGKPLEVVLPGTQRRNFTYVKDLAHGIILTGEKGHGDGYALNSIDGYSVLDIAGAFGGEIKLVPGNPGRNDTSGLPTKAWDELGWKTTLGVMDFIEQFKRDNPRP